MKIAITGASGFIATQIAPVLKSRGAQLIGVCRKPGQIKQPELFNNVLGLDISQALPRAFEMLGKPDCLLHLAWGGLPNYKSLHHVEHELPAQFKFLKSVVEQGLNKLVVTGTCFEYGLAHSGPLHVELNTQPSNPYGFAKDTLRKQLLFLKETLPFKLTWARLFYMYGNGQADSSLYSLIKQAVARGDRVFNMSGGEQLRDFLPIHELVEQIVDLVINETSGDLVNVCSGKPVSIRNLVESWIEQNNWDIQLNLGYYPYPDYEPMAFWGVK